MSKNQSHANEIIAGEAADWFIAMRDECVSDEQRERFASWLITSPVHVREYLAIAELWGDLAAVDVANKLIELAPSPKPETVIPISINRQPISGQAKAHQPQWGKRGLALLGGVCALSVLWLAMYVGWQEPTINTQHYRSSLGQQRTVTLEDNTVIHLNTLTELSVEYSDSQRRVNLVAGEAMFDVHADAARPFIVRSGPARIAVTGTEFNVYKQPRKTVVTVIEGAVDVVARNSRDPASSMEHASPSSMTRLTAMQQAVVSVTDDTVIRRELADLRAATAWLKQQLYFEAEPLSNIVAEFNRYNVDQLYVADVALSKLKLTASFTSTNPEAFLLFLERTADVTITSSPDGTRIIDVSHNQEQ